MKLGKIFICINILVLSLLMLTGCTEKWPRIIYQNTSYRFDEYNRTIVLDDGYVLDGGHSYDIVETENGYDIISILLQNENCTEGEGKTLKIIKIIMHRVMYERYALSAAVSLNLIQRLNVMNGQLFVHAVIRASPLEKNILRQGE